MKNIFIAGLFLLSSLNAFAQKEKPCAKDGFESFSGAYSDSSVTYLCYIVSSEHIRKTDDGYEITHPNFRNPCEEVVTFFKDEERIIEYSCVGKGEPGKVIILMKYKQGIPRGIWTLCPMYALD